MTENNQSMISVASDDNIDDNLNVMNDTSSNRHISGQGSTKTHVKANDKIYKYFEKQYEDAFSNMTKVFAKKKRKIKKKVVRNNHRIDYEDAKSYTRIQRRGKDDRARNIRNQITIDDTVSLNTLDGTVYTYFSY